MSDSNGTHHSQMFFTFCSSNQNVDSNFLQHKKRQKRQLQLCNGNFTANNKQISAFTLLVYSTSIPSQLSEYLFAQVTYLKFTSWSCISLIPSQILSKASFLLRKYSSQYIQWVPSSLSCSISSYLH